MNNLGAMYAAQGKFASATALLEKVLQVQQRVLGEEHPSTLAVLHNTFGLLLNQGKFDEATPIATKVLAINTSVL